MSDGGDVRARLLVNPAAGRGAGARSTARLAELAAAAGVALEAPAGAAELRRAAARAVADGVERLVVAGGDGTVHQVLQEVAGSATALAVVPVGTGNDLAAELGVPRRATSRLPAHPGRAGRPERLDAAFAAALAAPVRRLDCGVVRPVGGGERRFAGIAGVGFDSEVARAAERVRRLRGPLVYAWSVVATLGSFRPPLLELEHDGGRFRGRITLVALANSGRFGGGMRIAPGARLDDGLLDAIVVREVPKAELLRVFPRVYRGTHVDHPAVEIVRTRRARLALLDRPLVLHADGEPVAEAGPDGLEIAVEPGRLRAVVPATGWTSTDRP